MQSTIQDAYNWLTGANQQKSVSINNQSERFNRVYNASTLTFEQVKEVQIQDVSPLKKLVNASDQRSLILCEFGDRNSDNIARNAIGSQCHKLIESKGEEEKKEIAQLIFLADKCPQKTLKSLENDVDIQGLFLSTLKKNVQANDPIDLQNHELAAKSFKEQAIAEALITEKGNLNLDLIDNLIDCYLNPSEKRHDYENDIVRVLGHLKQSKELQKQFASLSSINICKEASEIAKITAGSREISHDILAKRAALATLLCSLRQGPVGSCFATSIGIEIEHERLDFYLRDIIQLLQSGALLRKIDGEVQRFPYIAKIADSDLDKPITVEKEGTVTIGGKEAKLWEIPGFITACSAMEMDCTEDTLKGLIPEGNTTAEAVITALASKSNKALSIGLLAFSGRTNCCLARMWENVLADMSEGDKQSIMRSMILSTVGQILNPYLNDNAQVAKVFKKTFNDSFFLEFDPNIKLDHTSADGSSTEGGFALYSSAENERKDSPEGFQSIVLGSLKATKEKLENENVPYTQHKEYRETLKKVASFIEKDQTFLKMALWTFDDDNKNVPLENWKDLTMTPWLSKIGNDPHILFQVYTQRVEPMKEKHWKPKNCLDLFSFSVNRARELERKDRFLTNEDGGNETPLYLTTVEGIHAFSFTPKNSSFIDLVRSEKSAEDAIKEKLIPSGSLIADTLIKEESREKITDALKHNRYLPSDFTSVGKTHYEVAQECIKAVVGKIKAPADKVTLVITNLMNSSLPEELFSHLLNDAIIGFDTNWYNSETAENLYFCAFYNIATKSIDFGLTENKKGFLISQDHSPWLERNWEICETSFRNLA